MKPKVIVKRILALAMCVALLSGDVMSTNAEGTNSGADSSSTTVTQDTGTNTTDTTTTMTTTQNTDTTDATTSDGTTTDDTTTTTNDEDTTGGNSVWSTENYSLSLSSYGGGGSNYPGGGGASNTIDHIDLEYSSAKTYDSSGNLISDYSIDSTSKAYVKYSESGSFTTMPFDSDESEYSLEGISVSTSASITFKVTLKDSSTNKQEITVELTKDSVYPDNTYYDGTNKGYLSSRLGLTYVSGKGYNLSGQNIYKVANALCPNQQGFDFAINPTTLLQYAKEDVSFYKVSTEQQADGSTGFIPNAGFTLYDSSNKVVATAKSDSTGKVNFSDVEEGTYTLKETTTPDGYKTSSTEYTVTVNSDETFSITCGGTEIATFTSGSLNGKYYITNTPEVKITTNKTAEVIDYDSRLYKLDLSATATSSASAVTLGKDVDVSIVVDTSGSMIYTDAAIISTTDSSTAYDSLSQLNTKKIYFTDSISNYGSGYTLDSSCTDYFLSTAQGTSSGWWGTTKYYGLPTSGQYLFYDTATKAWYMKDVSYWDSWNGYEYYLETSDALSTTNATKLTTSNCPTTVYTNRSEMFITAAEAFVSNLSDNSCVSVIGFDYGNSTNTSMIQLANGGRTTVNTLLEAATGVYQEGTHPTSAIQKADTLLSGCKNDTRQNYMIYLADGDTDDNSTSVASAAKTLRDNGAIVYALALGTDYKDLLNSITGDSTKVISSTSMLDIAKAFSNIGDVIGGGSSDTGATVKDYIDSRFIVTDSDGKALSDGATITASSGTGTLHIDGTGTYIEWTNVEIGTETPWTASVYVKAQDSFIGGNMVPTNGASSGVTVGDEFTTFPQPTVNVKLLNYTVGTGSVTLFKGETTDIDSYIDTLNSGISLDALKLTTEDYETLKTDGTLTKDYTTGTDKMGTVTYTLSAKDSNDNKVTLADHTLSTTGTAIEVYTLEVTYTPTTVADRTATLGDNYTAPVGTAVTSETQSGTYTITVVDGQLTITKSITRADYIRSNKEGNATFTFKITGTLESGETVVFYKTLNFDYNGISDLAGIVTDNITRTTTITGLEKGTYVVEEMSTLGYETGGISVDNNTNCYSSLDSTNYVGTFKIGTDNNEKSSISATTAAVTFTNTNTHNDNNFTDTDVTKNSLVIGNTIDKNDNVDNSNNAQY